MPTFILSSQQKSSQRSAERDTKQAQSAEAAVNSNRAATNPLTTVKENKMHDEGVPSKKGSSVQTGSDRYINVKRKSILIKSAVNTKKFQPGTPNSKKPEILNGNRFAILIKGPNDDAKGTTTVVNAKHPPIYLRERSSNALVAKLSKIVDTKNFHIVPLK
ncbi:uncharacterized protein LOC125779687 [Bactrocera dorsalis]|uniref:Uncharacterized protein LOC125779687 n=1 Tax=Bactrocera dorsalis TaxID=27457 RepID=A0ABM3K608_BACDO|nr:uncharacterized protein LOC125779687 [Bactrocera dorsalis]